MNTSKTESKVGKYVTIGAAVTVVLFMLMPKDPTAKSANADPKVFVSCETSRKAIAAADKRLTGYMDSEAELETDVRFGKRAYTSTTFHDQASLLIGREEARERYLQLLKTASEHGC